MRAGEICVLQWVCRRKLQEFCIGYFFYVYVYKCFAYMYRCMHVQHEHSLRWREEDIRSPGIGGMDGGDGTGITKKSNK